MQKVKWFYLPALVVLLVGATQVAAAEEETSSATDTTQAADQAVDEDWLNTVWTQVDDMVKQESLKLQETVTVAGVRGAEAEDNILDKLYYKGGKRYPSQDKLKKAIDVLKKSIAQNPKTKAVPKQKFFIAQCYEKLGQLAEARTYYTQVTKDHPKSDWATKAQTKLSQLAVTQ